MQFDRFLTLMYHNVVRDGGLRSGECARLGHPVTTYFVEETTFRAHVGLLAREARVLSMSDIEAFYWNRFNPPRPEPPNGAVHRPCVLLTFDDGWKGCLEVATAPLREAEMEGLMFVTTDFVGTEGFCTWEELRDRDRSVWRIGSHSVHHIFLNELRHGEIYQELRDSKRMLEDQLEEPIHTVSIPNGAVSDSVRAIAHDVGYSYVFTSDVQFNTRDSSPFDLGRIAVYTGTSVAELEQWLNGRIGAAAWKRTFLQALKFLLGPRRYRLFRSRWMGDNGVPCPTKLSTTSPIDERRMTARGVP
jgi:peptidoglycan/xylan/chitin deacetylase (PgdA/CDA1 family)